MIVTILIELLSQVSDQEQLNIVEGWIVEYGYADARHIPELVKAYREVRSAFLFADVMTER